jgi:hypothetical protein
LQNIFGSICNVYIFKGEFVRRSEIIFSANYYGFDNVAKSNVDGEQIGDMISAIPFEEMISILQNLP